MVTKAQAVAMCDSHYVHIEFHHGKCNRTVGPRGGVTLHQTKVRRSGKTQTWKTRPEEFRIPVKYGLYENHEITHLTASVFHVASECTLNDKD